MLQAAAISYFTASTAAISSLQWPQARAQQIMGRWKEGRWEARFGPFTPSVSVAATGYCRLHAEIGNCSCLYCLVLCQRVLVLHSCSCGNPRAACDFLSSRCQITVSLPVQNPVFTDLAGLSSSLFATARQPTAQAD